MDSSETSASKDWIDTGATGGWSSAMADGLRWMATVDAFVHAGEQAERVLGQPAVASRWTEPSSLPGFTVGGIAGHLLGVLRAFERRCDLEVPDGTEAENVGRAYAMVRLSGLADLDDAPFHIPRDSGEQLALRGHAALCDEFDLRRRRRRERLRAEPLDRLVVLPDETKSTSLHDYTLTRIVELVVHADDLASSVGARADPPADALAVAVDFLVSAVRLRIGDAAALRALAGRHQTDVLRAL